MAKPGAGAGLSLFDVTSTGTAKGGPPAPIQNQAAQAAYTLQRARDTGTVLLPSKVASLEHIMALARARLVPRLVPPFARTFEYGQAMLWRQWALRNAQTLGDARAAVMQANVQADAVVRQLGVDIDRVWEATAPDDVARECLARGATLALAGAGAGAFLGPIGAGIGAAVGFVVGLILGLIPFERMEALDKWRATLKSRSPLERVLILSHVRDWAGDACRADQKPDWPALRWGESGGILGHNLWQDRRAYAVFLSEIAFEECALSLPSDGDWVTWQLAYLAGGHEDGIRLDGMRWAVGTARSSKVSGLLASHVERELATPAEQLRARARAVGLIDFNEIPETPGLLALAGA